MICHGLHAITFLKWSIIMFQACHALTTMLHTLMPNGIHCCDIVTRVHTCAVFYSHWSNASHQITQAFRATSWISLLCLAEAFHHNCPLGTLMFGLNVEKHSKCHRSAYKNPATLKKA